MTNIDQLTARILAISRRVDVSSASMAASASELRAIADQLPTDGVPMPDTDGVPAITEARLPMLNLHKAWYETTQRPGFPPYNVHPLKAEDYNLETGGDSDLDEPLVAPLSGLVTSADQFSGPRGRIVQILGVHETLGGIVWAGWHLRTLEVSTGDIVFVGDPIGTIGNAGGRYAAHLHNHMCVLNWWGIPSPTAYPTDTRYDWHRPSELFVELGVDPDVVTRVMAYDGR